MNDLIIQLKKFATEDFPVSSVSDYLNDYSLSNEILNEYAHFKDQKYCRNLVHKENDFEIIVVCWKAGQVAPIHGHEGEKCWARVQDGNLQICNYEEGSSSPLKLNMIQELSCAPGFLDGPADIHSVENITGEFATSLHVYAKPYDACDIYDIEKGTVDRIKLSYHSIDGILC